VHYLFIEGLLARGQKVSKRGTQAFDGHRIALTCSLLRHCAEQNFEENFTVQFRTLPYDDDEQNVTAVLPRIVSWLYTLEPQASLIAFVNLLDSNVECFRAKTALERVIRSIRESVHAL
jgi:hypothetical protein